METPKTDHDNGDQPAAAVVKMPLPPHPAFSPSTVIAERPHNMVRLLTTLIILILAVGITYYSQHRQTANLAQRLNSTQTRLAHADSQVASLQGQLSAATNRQAASASLLAWNSLDPSLQQAILTRWQALNPAYASAPAAACQQPQNQKYYVENDQYAAASIGCSNPEIDFLVKTGSTWHMVAHGPGNILCSTVLQYGIPLPFLALGNPNQKVCVMPDGSPQPFGN